MGAAARAGGGAYGQRRFQDEVPGGLKLGQRVRHAKFGHGIVLNLEGQGNNARVQVNFEAQGTKWLVLGYANLEVV
jgi:DNA helicase-2/ATP-dependent DNA helicase PcrA